jgi:hypothetical protein
MDDVALQLEHSVEADVSPSFAWDFRTDIANWNDPPAQFAIDGPFVARAQGTTTMPGLEPFHWCVREVQPGKSFLIEMPLDHAALCFFWRFDALSERRTKITQRIELSGSNAGAYVGQVQAAFGSNLSAGMQRIAAEMAAAEKAAHGDKGVA